MLNINMFYRKGILIIEIEGFLNRFTSYKLSNYLVPIILKHELKYIIYDTKKLKGTDKVGLKVLRDGIKAVKANKGKISYTKDSKILKLIEG